MTKELYNKFITNSCTTEDLNKIIEWLKSPSAEDELRKWSFEQWNTASGDPPPPEDEKFNQLFDVIQKKINEESGRLKKQKIRKKVFINWITRAAAIMFFPLLTYFLYTISNTETGTEISPIQYTQQTVVDSIEIISPVGSRTALQLSDGTKVHLNFGSKLKYPQTFSDEIREVVLEGEGYFEVAHNTEKPFLVKTEKSSIKALGTTFNVSAYSDTDVIETTLVDGEVVFESDSGVKNNLDNIVMTLAPGEHVSYNAETGETENREVDVERYVAWKDGKLVFEDSPITEITQKLERKYNVEIEVNDDIKDFIYTVTFLDEPIMQILDLMTIATPVAYQVLPRNKLADGTFSKQKIIIVRKSR